MSYPKPLDYVDAKESIANKILKSFATATKYIFVAASVSLNIFLFIGVVELEAKNNNLKFQVDTLNAKIEKALIPEPTLSKFLEAKINSIFSQEPQVVTKAEDVIEQPQEVVVDQKQEITFERVKKSVIDLWNISVN